jgi:hypothetical protein
VKAFIVLRDRVTYARRCLMALLEAGLEPVVVDHGSTWPEAVAWLDWLEMDGRLVLRRGGGRPQAIWEWEPFREACGSERYILTDPDSVPSEDCPPDWPARLSALLDRFPKQKAGLGLRIDRIPPHYQRRDHVLSWEQQFWQQPLADGVYDAAIDTTLAMYRPLSKVPYPSGDALRTGPPYVADHLAWYEDLDDLTPELRWYYEHIEPGIAFWTAPGKSCWGN